MYSVSKIRDVRPRPNILQQTTTEVDPNELRFFLMGKTGNGKSATGNTLLGRTCFFCDFAFKSVTTTPKIATGNYGNNKLKIMDSPGLFDTEQSEANVAKIIVQAVAQLLPGPHVFLFVIRAGRYTSENHGVYSRLKALLDDRIKQYIIVIFTFADEFEKAKKTPDEVIKEGPENFKKLMADCNNRYVLFNNDAIDSEKQNQVNQLMQMVQKLDVQNKSQPYQCPAYAFLEEEIENETKKRLGEVQKKELERNEHYKKLEEEIKKRDRQLNEKEKELEKREQEIIKKESTERKKLEDEIKQLQLQLEVANKQQSVAPNSDDKKDQQIRLLEEKLAGITNEFRQINNRPPVQQIAKSKEQIDAILKEREKLVKLKATVDEKLELMKTLPDLFPNKEIDYGRLEKEKREIELKLVELQNIPVSSNEYSNILQEVQILKIRKSENEQELEAAKQNQALFTAKQEEYNSLRMDRENAEIQIRKLQEQEKVREFAKQKQLTEQQEKLEAENKRLQTSLQELKDEFAKLLQQQQQPVPPPTVITNTQQQAVAGQSNKSMSQPEGLDHVPSLSTLTH